IAVQLGADPSVAEQAGGDSSSVTPEPIANDRAGCVPNSVPGDVRAPGKLDVLSTPIPLVESAERPEHVCTQSAVPAERVGKEPERTWKLVEQVELDGLAQGRIIE